MTTDQARPAHRSIIARPHEDEPRASAAYPARVRGQAGWSDVILRNVSSHGMLVESSAPFPRGTVVEIRCGRATVIGQVVWSRSGSFGVESRDPVELDKLSNGDGRDAGGTGEGAAPARKSAYQEFLESEASGSMFQFVALAGAAMVAGYIFFVVVSKLLLATFGQIGNALG